MEKKVHPMQILTNPRDVLFQNLFAYSVSCRTEGSDGSELHVRPAPAELLRSLWQIRLRRGEKELA